jgi:hypothetical protein
MGLRPGLSLAWRLVVGVLLAGALVFVTQFIDWQSSSNAFLRPLSFPMIALIAILSALLIQSFSRRFSVVEVLVNTAIVFAIACLLFPPVAVDHSRRRERPPPMAKPAASRR